MAATKTRMKLLRIDVQVYDAGGGIVHTSNWGHTYLEVPEDSKGPYVASVSVGRAYKHERPRRPRRATKSSKKGKKS
jgi:hypothetical protein